MKILCVSDHSDPVVYSDNIRKRFGDVQLVISCGDLPFSYYDFLTSNLNKPLLFVFGNHQLTMLEFYDKRSARPTGTFEYETIIDKKPPGVRYIDGKVIREKGLIVAGLGGSMDYNHGAHQYTNSQMMRRVIKLMPRLFFNRIFRGRFLDILVTHAPPSGIHDQPDLTHRGFAAFLWFIRRFKPAFLIHGHIHLYSQNEQRQTQYHKTKVVNAFNHTVIEIAKP
jgi:hypothetical protein